MKFQIISGHSESIYGFGLRPPSQRRNFSVIEKFTEDSRGETDDEGENIDSDDEENYDDQDSIDGDESEIESDDSLNSISKEELYSALSNALRVSALTVEEICALEGKEGGWKLVHRVGDSFCLFKRRLQVESDPGARTDSINGTLHKISSSSSSSSSSSPRSTSRSWSPLRLKRILHFKEKTRISSSRVASTSSVESPFEEESPGNGPDPKGAGGTGPIQYLMTGNCEDVSPLTFLHAQVLQQALEFT